ncbi:hypothetical protein [Actimicrobium sp. GrIS 1.19]|uniref:hypothetical protein n=1 Tax=Actimicrobium sp. GrIS 1.19 TaxID=3071708 RepID=UPI002E12803D
MIIRFGRFALLALLVFLTCAVALPTRAATLIRQIPRSSTLQFPAANLGIDGLSAPEVEPTFNNAPDLADGPTAAGGNGTQATSNVLRRSAKFKINRSIARHEGHGMPAEAMVGTGVDRHLLASFDGLNSRNQRLASGGNQFSVEPPDQALCVGNGYVLESVNDVLKVFDGKGAALTGDIALNAFYGYPPAINRQVSPRVFGPSITDPVCYYDPQVRRWFHAVLTLDTDPVTGAANGNNHLDLAVSSSANPLGSWTVYRIAVQDDGTQGTPTHPNCPCLGDYPHIGADAHGIYLTTNEFPFSGGFNSAQIYAMSKAALVAGSTAIKVVQIDTADYLLDGNPGFTVWPAVSPSGDFEDNNRGTEYLMSSTAVFTDSGNDNRLRFWALGNTRSLNSATPALTLQHSVVNVDTYGVPPAIVQKEGLAPLRDCLNDRSVATPFGPGCWNYLTATQPAVTETLADLDPNDSRMQQVFFTGGKLYAALDTIVNVAGVDQTGIAYYILKPRVSGNRADARVLREGRIALAGHGLTRPAIAALPGGKGVIAFSLIGANHYPSAAYVRFNDESGHRGSTINLVAEGMGADDEFGNYQAFGTPRSRWGDYGAAAVDGRDFWVASEYIARSCTLAQFVNPAALLTCGGTRVALTNWSTRVSRIEP